jgi:hypothetical protein
VNRDLFAHKVLSALHVLGYESRYNRYEYRMISVVAALRAFQRDHGLPETSALDATCLRAIDTELAAREQQLEPIARRFPFYGDMRPLHGNMVPAYVSAAMHQIALEALPVYLRMDVHELLNCIDGQCLGKITDPDGDPWTRRPIDPADDYRVEVNYVLDVNTGNQPSASAELSTILHEYAHYLDSAYPGPQLDKPLMGFIDTPEFHALSFDTSVTDGGCVLRDPDDPAHFISAYGYGGGSPCPEGMGRAEEEFAEAFAAYVASARHFRAAAAQNPTIAAKYAYLRDQVFNGREYDTDLTHTYSSGCNDMLGTEDREPGYLSCDPEYVWDWTLPLLREGAPLCEGPCDDGAACTGQDGCGNGRCEGVSIAGCTLLQAETDGGATADVYAQAQSFLAPAVTLDRIRLYIHDPANRRYPIYVVEELPRPSADDPRRTDPGDRWEKTVARLDAQGLEAGWVEFVPSAPPVFLTPGKRYFILREVPDGTFDASPSRTWAQSRLGPHPGPYADGTGYFLHRTGGWLDWAIRPEDENHFDHAFEILID